MSLIDWLISGLYVAKERGSKLKGKSIKITLTETCRGKK